MPSESVHRLSTSPENDKDGVRWSDMVNPTEGETRVTRRAFGTHPLTTDDIETQETREKVEGFPSYYLACLRSFRSIEVGGVLN